MAKSEVTTSNNPAGEREFFSYGAVFSEMAESVKKHNPELFVRCANMLDMNHVVTLRGLSYLGWLLAQDDGENAMQKRMATEAIAELSSLMASMIEFQNEAELVRIMKVAA